MQLLITAGFISWFVFHEPTARFVRETQIGFWLMIASIVTLFATMIALVCCEGLRRKSPINFILLGVFTLAQSFMLGVMYDKHCWKFKQTEIIDNVSHFRSAKYERFEVLLAVGVRRSCTQSGSSYDLYFLDHRSHNNLINDFCFPNQMGLHRDGRRVWLSINVDSNFTSTLLFCLCRHPIRSRYLPSHSCSFRDHIP